MDKWYTCKELAKILKVNFRTIHKLIKVGKLKAVDFSNNALRPYWKIHDSAYMQFIAESYQTQVENKTIQKLYLNDINEKEYDNIKTLINEKIKIDKKKCWICPNIHKTGYGFIKINIRGKNHFFLAHRLSYLVWKGKINRFILHKCHNPACCNPDHLYDGTGKQNAIDREERRKGIDHLK